MYPGNDITDLSQERTVVDCQNACLSKKECEIFTITVTEENPSTGFCNLKKTRGNKPNKQVKKHKISGSGIMNCTGNKI